ncbi:hypothetical protein C8F04DRAFT_302677 [Mycena alexandri]|uniref:F-box domain-containing protein n=1 Tax=Mycena alexandri TaxID=1745969 RepID=A0AAD6WPI4_9AGAR|nr:hypothetical protein C8F04DRAFT_302677 [Mycena alexandri]
MDIALPLNPDFCGPIRMPVLDLEAPKSIVTLKSLLADRALTVKRPRQQPPSLIFSLPAEMLAETFLQATADDQSASSMLMPMHLHFVLSQVCGLWRAVALHTPSLWCRVVLHLAGRTAGFNGIKSLAKTCFERSCDLPLALIITSSVFDSTNIPNLPVELVLPVRHRIRHLELQLPAILTESIFKLPRNSLRALKTINITALVQDNDGSWFRSMSALEGARLLDSITLSCVYSPRTPDLRFDPYMAGLSWDRLTELRLHDLEIQCDDVFYFLEMTSALVRCSLNLRIIPPLVPVIPFTGIPAPADLALPKPKAPVTVPALRVFELAISSGSHNAPADFFFNRMVFPSLKELSIKFIEKWSLLPCATLTELQTRSAFSLEQFTLASRTGDSLLPFLQSNPLLWRVQLVLCAVELVPLVTALTLKAETGDGAPILPRLRILTLADHWPEETPASSWTHATKAVDCMVRSRRRAPSINGDSNNVRLEGFTFGSRASLSAKKIARFERWRAEGMRIRTVIVPHESQHPSRSGYNRILWQELE